MKIKYILKLFSVFILVGLLGLFLEEGGKAQFSGGGTGGGTSSPHSLLGSSLHSDTVTSTPVLGGLIYGNSTPAWAQLAGPTAQNLPYFFTSTPVSGVAQAPAWSLSGVPFNTQACGSPYTILNTDRGNLVQITAAGACAITLPQAGTGNFTTNFNFAVLVTGAGTVTVTPTTSTINGTSSFVIATNQIAYIYSDNANYFARVAGTSVGGAIVFPQTVSGTTTSGGIPYYASTTSLASSAILNSGFLIKGGGAGAAPTNTLCDEAITTANTLTCTNTAGLKIVTLLTGTAPPATTAGSAGAFTATEGTAFTNVSGAAGIYPDSTSHEFVGKTNGASTGGILVRAQPSAIHSTGNTASISTATLCASAAGACNVAGQYNVHWDFIQTGTACSVVTAGGVTFTLSWTDNNSTAHAHVMPMIGEGAIASAPTSLSSFFFQTALTNAFASGNVNIYTNGTVIQYATTYTACTTGTGTYQLDITVTRLQ